PMFAKAHRGCFTPRISILVTAGLMLVLTLKSSFVAALTISTIARLVAYAVTCASLPVLRRRGDAPPAHFKLRGGPVIAIAALVLSAWLLLNSTLYEAIATAIAALVGFAIYLAYRLLIKTKLKPQMNANNTDKKTND